MLPLRGPVVALYAINLLSALSYNRALHGRCLPQCCCCCCLYALLLKRGHLSTQSFRVALASGALSLLCHPFHVVSNPFILITLGHLLREDAAVLEVSVSGSGDHAALTVSIIKCSPKLCSVPSILLRGKHELSSISSPASIFRSIASASEPCLSSCELNSDAGLEFPLMSPRNGAWN